MALLLTVLRRGVLADMFGLQGGRPPRLLSMPTVLASGLGLHFHHESET